MDSWAKTILTLGIGAAGGILLYQVYNERNAADRISNPDELLEAEIEDRYNQLKEAELEDRYDSIGERLKRNPYPDVLSGRY